MLTSALRHYRSQQKVAAMAVTEARRSGSRGIVPLVQTVIAYQLASIVLTFESTASELSEQGITAPPVARPVAPALLTAGTVIADRFGSVSDQVGFDRLVATLVQDAGRTAATVDLGRRPALTGHVRSLNLPSCSRCAVLAGRVYRYSEGFLRHPLCDCLMTPTTLAAGQNLVLDPTDAVKNGQIRGLSQGDLEAIDLGADLGQVVNVRRAEAGLTVGSSVVERGGRMTPQGIMRTSSSREQSIDLLSQFGYLT